MKSRLSGTCIRTTWRSSRRRSWCWCKTDSCGDVEIGYEAVLDILESVKERLQEYLKCHDNDVIFEME